MLTITLPTVGGDNNVWGGELNGILAALNGAVLGAWKTADQSVTSSTTLTNDTSLTLPVTASGIYVVEWSLVTDGPTAGDIQYAFTGPAGAAMTWESEGAATTDTTNVARAATDVAAIGTPVAHGLLGHGTNNRIDGKGLLIVSTTAGNLTLQFAQNTSNATATRVRAGSWIKAFQVGP